MAARSPRRSFASPFVITIAAAVPACHVQTGPGSTTPTTQPAPAPAPADPAPVTSMSNPPRPSPAPTPTPSPTPAPTTEPATPSTQRWNVSRRGTTCTSQPIVSCPSGAICNPPPPKAYACPPALADGSSVKVYRQTTDACFVEQAPMTCPPNVMCNPPPPQKVACPS